MKPDLVVVRGNPTDAELAALLAAISTVTERRAARPAGTTGPLWGRRRATGWLASARRPHGL